MAGGPSHEVKRFTSGRVFAGSSGFFRAIHARPETPRNSLCRKHLRALVGLLVVGAPCSSNLPPPLVSSVAYRPASRLPSRFCDRPLLIDGGAGGAPVTGGPP